ncbi:MAG: class I SAM-dependent methyltransferase [Bacteroidales bacterium]|nr:class I SAM-dependent methyltransferase [Bacteroidales bacterium]MBN2698842.1 class I SAM-dependent methyltransferase [Bacteroidales bacterium]
MKTARYLQTLGSFRNYYRSMKEILVTAFGRLQMLHYPFYLKEDETFEERQQNLIDHCLSYIGDLKEKNLLEVGCGNGLNCHYIHTRYGAKSITGIDISKENLDIAKKHFENSNIRFIEDNAQELVHIPDRSVDVILSVESAFHYPDKNAFFRQIKRVLRPGGVFLIVDIVRFPGDTERYFWFWKKSKMMYHADETEYHQYSSGNNLVFKHKENLTDRIIRGYEGHISWISGQNRNLFNYMMLKLFTILQVRFNVAQLRSSKQYMLFYGGHGEA